eukprot:Transcript_27744.p1 GENE.Transcript_27744~~Transcript_27744.p1  ORF type:complete len:816 (+),score=406.70 Transcript_27744:122-2569(+)
MDGEEVEEEYEESIDLGEEEDDDLDGSPKSVAWKYAWSMNSSNVGSARGAGNAASERLYSGARSNREAREKLQRQELRRAHKTETRHKPAINQKSAEMAETRFDDVMNRTAIGRYRKEVRAIAGVKGGAKEAGRVKDVFNYGDMLFQEGKMTAARKDQARSDELRRRERDDPECTFKPKVSGLARQFAHHEHLAERSESLIIEQQERMQALANAVRSEADRDLTFKPAITNKKTLKLAGGREKDFVTNMEKRAVETQQKKQLLARQYEEQDRSCFTYRPEIGRQPRGRTAGPLREPIHERLYEQHTAAYAQTLKPEETGDPECTFHPNMGAHDPGRSSSDVGDAARLRSRAQLEEVGDALYKDAHNRRLRRQMLQEQLNAELEEVRSSSKCSSKSQQLAFTKLQRDVADIYERLEAAERGITYEELAAAMVELGLFKTSLPTAAIEQASPEVLLLQRVWRHLVDSTALDATLAISPLLRFLRAALLPLEEARPDALKPPAADPQLFSDFAALWRNTLSYKGIRNVRGNTEALLMSEAEKCTFNPAIDKRSRKLDAHAGGAARHEQLYENARQTSQKIEKARIKELGDQMKACSFKPEINKKASVPLSPSKEGNSLEAGERLYHHATAKMLAEENVLSTTDLEVAQQCTFKPQIFTKSYSPQKAAADADAKPLGYQQAVGRMRRAQEEREARELEEQSVAAARAATTAAASRTDVKPFAFQTDRRQERKQPLLYMDVNLGPGKTGRIGLHQGDDAAMLAANFARAYQLDGSMRDRLQQLIEKYMAEVLPGLASQAGSPTSPRRAPAAAAAAPHAGS